MEARMESSADMTPLLRRGSSVARQSATVAARGGGGGGRNDTPLLLRVFLSRTAVVVLGLSFGAALVVVMVAVLAAAVWGRPAVQLTAGLYLCASFHDLHDVAVYAFAATPTTPVSGTAYQMLLGGTKRVSNLRSMTLLPDGSMLITQAMPASAVFRLTNACKGSTLQIFTRVNLNHPYGIASFGGIVYVSNQNGNTVTYYNSRTAAPIGNGVFTNIVNPRGVAVDPNTGRLYVSSRGENALVEFDTAQLTRLRSWAIRGPIQVAVSNSTAFVGSAVDNTVSLIDLQSGNVLQNLTDPLLLHPAGIAVDNAQNVFVGSQDNELIFSWSPVNGNYVNSGQWSSNTPKRSEGLLILQC